MPRKKTAKIQTNFEPMAEIRQGDSLSDMVFEMGAVLDPLNKSVKPGAYRRDLKIDGPKVVFSSATTEMSYDGSDNKGMLRMSDDELRQAAILDPYISAIISNRCGQGQAIGRRSESKFSKGTRVLSLDEKKLDDFKSEEEFEKDQEIKRKYQKQVLEWVLKCGTRDENVLDTAYALAPDLSFKHCSLSDYISAQIRNLLTFGRSATQLFRDGDGIIQFFRPLPVETIKRVNWKFKRDVSLANGPETTDQSKLDVDAYNALPDHIKPDAYVQYVEGQKTAFFTEYDIKFTYFQKQALFGLNGYPLAPIEMAIFMVFIHRNTMGYMRNQFVKGLGTKMALGIECTDPSAELSSEDLDRIRKEFHNFLCRTDNSASIPIISGPVRVTPITLSPTPRDMEFLAIEEHVIRAICAAMQISPQEMGYGNLSTGQGGITQANKQEEIVRGEERGLRTLLDPIYDTINDILWESFSEINGKFAITYTGVGEDTRDAVVSRSIQEIQTTATLNSLYADSEKTDLIPIGGDVPLSPMFHQNVVRYMHYGVFMEKFFNIEGASKDPRYDFLIDPSLNQSYQMKIQMSSEMSTEQGKMQLEAEKMQMQPQQGQEPQSGQQDQENSTGKTDQNKNESDIQEQNQAQPEDSAEQSVGPKSLKQTYGEKVKLNKSMSTYFSEWISAHSSINNDD